MRVPQGACSRLNESCSEWVATKTRIGIDTSPKLSVPEPMERAGMRPPSWARKAHGTGPCQTGAVLPWLRRMHLVRDVARAAVRVPATAYFYDCLALFGRDLRGLPLADRKALLRELLAAPGAVRYADHVEGDGAAFLDAACKAGLEGVVAKRADARYLGGRRTEWRKIKCVKRQEFVIGGYTDPKGTRAGLGAVHLGVYDGDALVYAGRAGSGLDRAGLDELAARLRPLTTERCPFTRGSPPRGPEHHWVRPVLVCEVRFSEWTSEGLVRHPVYLGLRSDRRPREVRAERAVTPRS